MTKNFWDTIYFWVIIVSLKDLFLVISPAIVTDGVDSLSLCGFMYVGYSVLTMVALPYTDNSSNVIDAILFFMISLQMLQTISLGFADGPCTNADARSDSKVAARASWILVVSARRQRALLKPHAAINACQYHVMLLERSGHGGAARPVESVVISAAPQHVFNRVSRGDGPGGALAYS